MARDVSTSLRELSQQLHPTRLRLIGLVRALESLCAELSHAGVAISYTYDNVPSTLPPDATLCLFRVAQEALQNALRHSRATEVSVQISGTSDRITLTIVEWLPVFATAAPEHWVYSSAHEWFPGAMPAMRVDPWR